MNILSILKPIVEKIPFAANFYRYIRDKKSLNREVIYRNNLGFFFNGSISMEKGEFDLNETFIIESFLDTFDTFINIGANTGYYVCKALKKGVQTIAFEPNLYNIKVFLKNIEANNFSTKLHFFPVALSNKVGVLPMYGTYTSSSLVKGWMGQKQKNLVSVSTFDEIALPLVENKPCFIVIDIEGAELDCLKGAKKLLSSKSENVFFIEISVSDNHLNEKIINPNLYETFSLMDSYGYDAYTADKNIRKIELSEVSKINSSNINTLNIPNFLFARNKEILSKTIFK